ncbi:hypothetical protein ABZP36_011671 [Zizania latifolia]
MRPAVHRRLAGEEGATYEKGVYANTGLFMGTDAKQRKSEVVNSIVSVMLLPAGRGLAGGRPGGCGVGG